MKDKRHRRADVNHSLFQNWTKLITRRQTKFSPKRPGQRAAIVIRLFYKDGGEQGKRNDFCPNGQKLNNRERLAKMAGVGNGSIQRLTEVYRNRLDLFDGTYTINKAYTPAHAREVKLK